MAEKLTRHPVPVIAAWIIIALVAAPLFASLNKVIKTQQYSLPPTAEASKADELIKQVRGGSSGFGLVLIQGVNVKDNRTLLELARWGTDYNKTLTKESVAKNPLGIPIILAEINKTLYRSLLANLTTAADHMKQLYEALDELDKAYAEALHNTTEALRRLNETAAAVAEADMGYARAYRALLGAANASRQLAAALVNLDKAYVNATDGILSLAEKLNMTVMLLAHLDEAYAGLAANLTSTYQHLYAAFSNKTLVSDMADGLAYTWWQAARTYIIMSAVGGNYSLYARLANLTSVDPRLAPLPPAEAQMVYQAVTNLTAKTGDVDVAALQVAEEMLAQKLPRNAQPLARVVAETWLREAKRLAAEHNSTSLAGLIHVDPAEPKLAMETQLLALKLAREAADAAATYVASHAAEEAATVLAKMLELEGLPAATAEALAASLSRGSLNTTVIATLVVEKAAAEYPELKSMKKPLVAVLVEADPEARGVLAKNPEAALEAAKKLLEAMGAPRSAVEAAAELVATGKLSRRDAAEAALRLLKEELSREKPEAAELLPLLARYDPEAQGVLAENQELLIEAIADVLAAKAAEQGVTVEPGALRELARMVVVEGVDPREAARRLALRLVAEEAAQRAGEKEAEMLLRILERFDPDARGMLAENRTLALEAVLEAARAQGMLPANATLTPRLVEELLSNETLLRRYLAEEMAQHVVQRAPPEARPVLEKFIEILEERGPGVPPEEKWRLIIDASASMIAKGVGLPRAEAERLAQVSALVAQGRVSAEEEARKLAEKLLVEEIAPKLLNETRGMLVSRRLNGFVVMFTPLGEDRDTRAENTVKAADIAGSLLARRGLQAEVLASGSDLLMKEVHEYAIKDAEKTSKISEAATFVVLLLILESVFAVLMPYVGIVLGLLVGGALVYLAARAGIVTVDSTAHSLMITTALGLGADYAAYLVHRFREELAKGREQREAAAHALATAGPAILASALTVIIGFGSLLLGWDIAFLRGMGETIPVTVAATAAASLTLVPALLALIGGKRWFWWPRRPSRERHAERESRLMRSLHRHHRLVLAALVAAMLVGAYFYATFKGSHDMKLLLPENAEAMKAFNVLKRDYMPGLTDPVYVAVQLPDSYWESRDLQEKMAELAKAIEALPGVGKVLAPNASAEGPLAMGGSMVSKDGHVALIEVILSVDPYSDNGTAVVRRIHDTVHQEAERLGLEAYVGGAPYAVLEMDKLLHERYYYRILPAASALMVLVFTVIFGSLPASIAALLVIVGSAMLGIAASVVVFKDILGKGVPWFLHIVSMMAVMGVGMDYNSFFLARALEECQRNQCQDTEEALARATGAVGLFIIGLAMVVSSAYLSMLSASNIGMQAMGFTLGVTILLAGLMAGYLFTPLVIALLGEKAWWPWGMKRRIRH